MRWARLLFDILFGQRVLVVVDLVEEMDGCVGIYELDRPPLEVGLVERLAATKRDVDLCLLIRFLARNL